jgi:uncharacterized OB-fold protein
VKETTMSDAYAKPLPRKDPLAAPFWEHAREERLAVQRCPRCGDLHFPPTQVCPSCLSEEQEWQVVSGDATIVSWVEFHQAYWPGFRAELPYNVVLVELAEGPRLLSNLVAPPAEGIRPGMKLRVVFDKATDELTLPKFAPA